MTMGSGGGAPALGNIYNFSKHSAFLGILTHVLKRKSTLTIIENFY